MAMSSSHIQLPHPVRVNAESNALGFWRTSVLSEYNVGGLTCSWCCFDPAVKMAIRHLA